MMTTPPGFLEEQELKNCLEFLDELPSRGIKGIWNAQPYLIDEFSGGWLTEDEATEIFIYWVRTYNERHPEAAK